MPITAIAQDLFLRRSKIFYQYIPEQLWKEKENYPHLFVYNDEYLYTGRKLLNHQGGSLFEFGNQQKKQNKTVGFVNFMANNNGFTLADLFPIVRNTMRRMAKKMRTVQIIISVSIVARRERLQENM